MLRRNDEYHFVGFTEGILKWKKKTQINIGFYSMMK